MTFQTSITPVVALALALGVPAQAKAEVSPTQLVVTSMAISACPVEYGIISHEIGEKIFERGVSELEPQVVRNVVANPTFSERVRDHIDDLGGCKSINNMLTKAATHKTSN